MFLEIESTYVKNWEVFTNLYQNVVGPMVKNKETITKLEKYLEGGKHTL